MANATITHLPDYYRPWVWSLKITSIDQDLFHQCIDSLKNAVNYRSRKWEPTGKRWLFHDGTIDDVVFVLDSYGVVYTIDDQSQRTKGRHRQAEERQSTAIMTRQQAAAELYLLPDAPPDVVTAVFRVLAKQYHPDMGGTTEQMQKLNAAMEVLR